MLMSIPFLMVLSAPITMGITSVRVQKKSRLHGCEPEEGFLNLCQFEEGPVIIERNLM